VRIPPGTALRLERKVSIAAVVGVQDRRHPAGHRAAPGAPAVRLASEALGSLGGVRTASTSRHGTQAGAEPTPRRPATAWTSRRAVTTHVVAAVVVPGCLVLAWWQATRALSGNTLSWAYTFEWPVFAGYAVYMWWKLVHDQPADTPGPAHADPAVARPPVGDPGPARTADDDARAHPAGVEDAGPDGGVDDGLAAYNDYLAALHASGQRKHWATGRRAEGDR